LKKNLSPTKVCLPFSSQKQVGPLDQNSISHYRILKKLGAGGMGEVYLAEDTRLGRKVALKLLPAALAADEDLRRRFAQESRAASALNHSHIITIYDIGTDQTRDFIAMEYVEGDSLRDLLSREPAQIKRALDLIAQAASGLAAAHQAGIIHRDIKPENLMVTRTSQLKILDFGLAKLIEKQQAPMAASNLTTVPHQPGMFVATEQGTRLGTVTYMSPEQAAGRVVDHRTDIFSLGVVLYEALTGKPPFRGDSAIDVLHGIINNDPRAALEVNPRLPAEVNEILDKSLAKVVSERYQHAGDFELDLRRLKRAIESNSLISVQTKTVHVPQTWWASKRALLLLSLVGLLVAGGIALAAWAIVRAINRAPAESSLTQTTLTQLTVDPNYDGEPTFSPDGQTIAYVTNRGGNFEIFRKLITGGAEINLTNNQADDVQPSFSPDGKQIAFVSTRSSSSQLIYRNANFPLMGGDIWIMPALGGSARKIADSGNFPSWSPDGSTIIYTSGPLGSQKILSVPSSGGEPREIPISSKTASKWLVLPELLI
jgi:eukaryotic-like serine/threonine-protein kinase